MNVDAKNFLLQIEDISIRRAVQVSFGLKITRDNIIDDITILIFKFLNVEQCRVLTTLLVKDLKSKIISFVLENFKEGKIFMISFCKNSREIILENTLSMRTSIYHNESIKWEIDNYDNCENITSSNTSKNPEDYKDLIPPELYKYLNFNTCLLRSDGELYIRSLEVNGKLNLVTSIISNNILLMLSRYQHDICETEKFHDNILRMKRWLTLSQNRENKLNWITSCENFFCIYVF